MISAFQRNERRTGTVMKRYNTLIHTVTHPKAFTKAFKPKKQSMNLKKIYQSTSQHLKWFGFISALFTIVNLILIFYETEAFFQDDFQVTDQLNGLRAIILVLCLVHSLDILLIHLLIADKFQFSYSDNIRDLFYDLSRLKYLFVDVFICMIHTPPGIRATIKFTQLGQESELSYSDIIFPLSLLRIKFLILFVAQQANESKSKSQIIMTLFPAENNLTFILKCVIHKWTYTSFLLVFWLSLVIFGACFRIFEKFSGKATLWDDMWLAFTTESTVGYGDIYPITHFGRFISGIAAILGVFMFSYSVMAVRDIFSLSKDETALSSLLRFKARVHHKLLPKAQELIIKSWKAYKSRSVLNLFELIEAAKHFKRLRNYLETDLTSTFDQQLQDSGKQMSKSLSSSLKIFTNTDSLLHKSKHLTVLTLTNYKHIRVFSEKFCSFKPAQRLSHLLIPKSILKKRKNAVKQLFVRRVANSPIANSSISNSPSSNRSSLSYSSID